jgi:DNA-directed RNA polymerase subunit RPC12/RpoP
MNALLEVQRVRSVLPRATVHKVRRAILGELLGKFQAGFWYCADCEHTTEREEGEQGQPAHCLRCGSHRIGWNRPALQEPL